jgi:hypothetical protein
MSNAQLMSEARIGRRTGGGHTAPGAPQWLGLAAAPTFAIMALWTGFFGGHPDMLCMAMQGTSPMSGMTMMYLLMSAFHAAPWLKLISCRFDRLSVAQWSSTARADGIFHR